MLLESTGDIHREVGLDILRSELLMYVTPPPIKEPTYIFESRQESTGTATNNNNAGNVTTDRLARLEAELERQQSEEEKWTDLKEALEKKTKQAADTVVRLTTSLTVFRNELANKTDRLSTQNEHLQAKQESADAHMEKLRKEQATQREQAERAKETAERAQEDLVTKTRAKNSVETRLSSAYQRLKPLDEKVQDLQVNLYGNTSLSSNQREYLKAEVKVEQDQRDRVRAQVHQLEQELEELSKECTSLAAKQALFQDEHKRRTMRFHSLETKIQEQDEFFQEQLQKYQEQVETVRSDRDAWETKTLKLATDLQDKQVESQKLNCKLSLFADQLKSIKAAVQRLTSLKEAAKNSSRSIRSTASSSDSDSDSSSGREEPASPTPEPKMVETHKTVSSASKYAYVWKPQTATFVTQQPTKTVSYIPAPPDVQNVVKVHQVSVKPVVGTPKLMAPSVSYQEPIKKSYESNSKVPATLEDIQRDLQHQKRFQREHALKMEQQYARLASKIEGLGVGDLDYDRAAGKNSNGSTSSRFSSMESQLQTLKLQVQKDALRDSHEMRQLMQQMNQQVVQLTNKLESLTNEAKRRDEQNAKLERKLKEKESQYFEQMEFLRGEMERQLERQQQIFADKISQAMIQMERVVAAGRGGKDMQDDSMSSLESLPPMEEKNDNQNTRGYSMASTGIKVFGGVPIFRK